MKDWIVLLLRSNHEGSVMKIKIWGLVIGGVIFFGLVLPSWALVFEKPIEGQIVVVGEPFDLLVRLEEGEVCEKIHGFEEELPSFNSKTKRYEWKETLPSNEPLGRRLFIALGEPVETCDDAHITLNVVLPPSTTVQSIDAHVIGNKGDKRFRVTRLLTSQKTFLDKFEDKIKVEGRYSDGVERDITNDPKTMYRSLDEKIATVTVKEKEVIVTPVGPGETEIVIEHGSYHDRVRVITTEIVCPEKGQQRHGKTARLCP